MAVSKIVRWPHRLEAWAFERYMRHFAKMPFEKASDAGADWLRRIGPMTPQHQTALRNIRLAYPEESEAWRRDLAIASWAQLGRVVGEFPHLPEITFAPDDPRTELAGGEIFDSVRDSGKGAVFISGHFALFEIMPVAILRRGIRCVMTYRPINNPLIDEKVLALRKRYGATLQAAKGREGGMSLLRALKRGEAVALMNDQKYDEGIAAPFFGYDAMTADAPSRLALNFNVPLIPLSVRRLGRARFRVEAHDPIPLERDAPIEIAVRDAVALINQFIEAQVRAAPEQWFWVHKRWPRAAWEKAGLL